ncbi:MAG: hypothetical protein WC998_00570 [Candidatus Paceibacterota bacterium]|jgi:hypothetical protein
MSKIGADLKGTKISPFGESIDLFPHLDERAVSDEIQSYKKQGVMKSPAIQAIYKEICNVTEEYMHMGDMYHFSEAGDMPRLVIPKFLIPNMLEKNLPQLMQERQGAITPALTPELFDVPNILGGTVDLVPDMSYLLWMRSVTMVDESEEKEEWDFNPHFIMMKEKGQVQFSGTFTGQKITTRNDVWGDGINISWTWFETNKFRIKFANLIPKEKYQYFDQIADAIYLGVITAFTTGITGGINHVIRDINTAITELMRHVNYNNKAIWGNASFAVLYPPEFDWAMGQAIRLSNYGMTTEGFIRRFTPIMTTKLPASSPSTIYVVVMKEEQNEYNTRLSLEVHGPEEDIETFSTKLTFRGAYGSNLNVASARRIVFDPDACNFAVAGPLEVKAKTSICTDSGTSS